MQSAMSGCQRLTWLFRHATLANREDFAKGLDATGQQPDQELEPAQAAGGITGVVVG